MSGLVKELKEHIYAEFGCEDEFRIVAKTEINAFKGIIRITEINLKGEEVVSESNLMDLLVSTCDSVQGVVG